MFGFGSNRNPNETREERRERRREANQEASARYAVQAYRDEGTPIPPHLRDRVDAQIARGDYAPRSADRDSRRGNILNLFTGPAPGSTASILGTPRSAPTTSILGTRRSAPTPGPNYYAGLGAPGVAREDSFVAPIPISLQPLPASPAANPPAPPAPVAPTPLPASPAAPSPVAAAPQFTFEQYLAMLNSAQGFAPPPVVPLAMASSPQGIMSLPPAGLMG